MVQVSIARNKIILQARVFIDHPETPRSVVKACRITVTLINQLPPHTWSEAPMREKQTRRFNFPPAVTYLMTEGGVESRGSPRAEG